MAEHFKHLQQLLALAGESFEEEVRRLVSIWFQLYTISRINSEFMILPPLLKMSYFH